MYAAKMYNYLEKLVKNCNILKIGLIIITSRKHAYIILTPLNPTFI